MDKLDSITAFVRSVELGSLSAAARALGTGQPTVSKLIASLEKTLGAKLLKRSTAGLSLTGEGQRFHERALRLLEAYDEAVADVREQVQQPRGLLRISAPRALGERRLNRLMLEFLERYPDIRIDLLLDDRFIDPLEERIDVSLRVSGRLPPELVARRIGAWPRVLVAAPAYLAARGIAERPEDLVQHEVLRYAGTSDAFPLDGPEGRIDVAVGGRYRVSSAAALLEAVQLGAGMALQPTWMVEEMIQRGELVQVLPGWTGPAQEAHLLYAPRRHLPLRVQVLLDFLTERLSA
ncbi:LysR family transcriptional regulator [Oxalobacteraceae bacterium]|nr:LysR family transcriptional regulator [Oxalobacteraceae bacterium]